jgi:hypothetical protein
VDVKKKDVDFVSLNKQFFLVWLNACCFIGQVNSLSAAI